MSIEPGDQLGSYTVVGPLGAGGMGEVYRASDTKLEREVAIKLLPGAMARDRERIARFEREAKLLASLNHPQIATIYGFDEADGKPFLIMELVEGLTLSERLANGPMPVAESIDIARQIAEALEFAHEKGIIHRDLKPANIVVTPAGQVKVLDFGLAKAMAANDLANDFANDPNESPTITQNFTLPGVILGTAAYMSPEQARGRPVDKRTDIWSFGCVLYECITGHSMFRGESISDSIGAILHQEPNWTKLPAETPQRVQWLLSRSMTKDPKQRLHDIADARIELQEIEAQPGNGLVGSDEPFRPATARAWYWPIISVALALALGASILWPIDTRERGVAGKSRSVVAIEKITDLSGVQFHPSVSPDGKQVLYVSKEGGDEDIFSQRGLGGTIPLNLTKTSEVDDSDPAFSPDGNSIAFRSEREGGGIFVMGATGESPRRISNVGFDPAWSPDGKKIVYTTEQSRDAYNRNSIAQLWIVDVATLEQTRILFDGDAVGPQWSPDGTQIAYWGNPQGQRDIFIVPASGGEPVAITQDVATDWNPLWADDGKSLYFLSDRNGSQNLWSVAVDRQSDNGDRIFEPMTTGVNSLAEASLSKDGQRCAIMVEKAPSEMLLYPFASKEGRISGDPRRRNGRFLQADTSPDGKMLAYRSPPPIEDIWVMQTDGTTRRRLTNDLYRDRGPRWSPDGQWLAFYANRTGRYEIWLMRPNGTEQKQLTDQPLQAKYRPCWSPDGKRIAFSTEGDNGYYTRFLELNQPLANIKEPIVASGPSINGFVALAWSPDGSAILGSLLKNESGVSVVYNLKDGTFHDLIAADGKPFGTSDIFTGCWIDSRRVIIADGNRQGAYLCDIDTGDATLVLEVEGSFEIDLTDDGNILVVNRARVESEIWMLELK